jgi:N-acetylglucosaminyldiphosphoundecaprenol N-acetyl-beta-D-mannosaminyltransferase
MALSLILKGKPVLERSPRMGRDCRPFNRITFAGDRHFAANWPVLFNILRGDMSFIGPRAAAPGEFCSECALALRSAPQEPVVELGAIRAQIRRLSGTVPAAYAGPRETAARLRHTVRPGLLCDWWIRRCANVAYDSEIAVDAEYVAQRGVRRDMQVFFRAMPALLGLLISRHSGGECQTQVRVQGIRLDNLTMNAAIRAIVNFTDQNVTRHVCFVNPQCANAAYKDNHYRTVLERADLVLSDGIGMKLAGIMLRREIRENVNGTDMFPRLCKALAQARKSVYLLGAQPGVAEDVARWAEGNYPGLTVKGCRDGYFTKDEEPEVAAEIAASGADVLLVAMGSPRQDIWIHSHKDSLGVKAAIGVGGLFDFYSGRLPRAPQWVREIGMEWFFRMMQEPGRMWKRYVIGNNIFLYHVLKEKLRKPQPEQVSPRHAQL